MKIMPLFLVLALSGCAEPPGFEKPRSAMTQREKDSILAASSLPGAGVVKKGMAIADAENRRTRLIDSLSAP